MRLLVACVGRGTKTPEQDLCEDYLARAGAAGRALGFSKVELAMVDVSRAASAASRQREEMEKLTARLPAQAQRVLLDPSGRARASEDCADYLARLRDEGVRDLAFLIGGPDGFSPEVKRTTKDRLAFGPQTWPHLLVRAMLAEQIYRAFSILARHPYHRG
jgi:23S rRNA (pseudouridine1915-N3)-methyltransferase